MKKILVLLCFFIIMIVGCKTATLEDYIYLPGMPYGPPNIPDEKFIREHQIEIDKYITEMEDEYHEQK